MIRRIKTEEVADAIIEELTVYHRHVLELLNESSKRAVNKLVKKTKATAPKKSGDFRKSISSTSRHNSATGDETHIWYVKAPHHRLTHLLVHGHATKNGGRTKGDPFLEKALELVLADYEKDVEEALG